MWPCRNEQRTNRLLLIGGEIGVGSSLFIKNQDPGRTRALHCLGRKKLSNPERKLWRFMASPRIQQSMWAFVILAQIASHWSHFNQSEPGLVFSDDAGGFTAGDDNGIAAASKKASDESKHFHGGRRNYSTLNICETVQNEWSLRKSRSPRVLQMAEVGGRLRSLSRYRE